MKQLSDQNKLRIVRAKEKRKSLGGDNYDNHVDQCNSIPEEFSETDCIHLEPCYKKFTLILSQSNNQKDPPQDVRKSKRRPSVEKKDESSEAWTYGPECYICKKVETQHNNKKVNPVQITTFQCAETVIAAAKEKNTDMYNELFYLDLVAKNFKMHDHCRKTFLKGFGEKARMKRSEPTQQQVILFLLSVALIPSIIQLDIKLFN